LPDLVIILGLTMIAASVRWLPSGGMTSVNHASLPFSQRLADSALHIALPAAALITSMAPIVVLHARAALAAVLNEPFVLSARAAGIHRFRLLLRHALPVASNPLITLAGFSIGALLNAGF